LLPEAQDLKPWLILFVGRAKEILARVRMLARKNEQQMRTLLREDLPSAPQEPQSPQSFLNETDSIQEIEDEKETA